MQLLKVERLGTEVQGIVLRGDKHTQLEPPHVRIVFPGGDVDVARCSDGSYWIHIAVGSSNDGEKPGRFVGARLDVGGKHIRKCDVGDFGHPDLYHLAVRVGVGHDPQINKEHSPTLKQVDEAIDEILCRANERVVALLTPLVQETFDALKSEYRLTQIIFGNGTYLIQTESGELEEQYWDRDTIKSANLRHLLDLCDRLSDVGSKDIR